MRRLAAMIALLAACGDNLRPLAVDDYPAAAREALCHRLVRCGEIESLEICRATNLGVTLAFTASERAAFDAGTIVYNALTARDCVDDLADQSCDTTSDSFRNGPGACDAIVAGTLGDGERCAFDLECRSRDCVVPACGEACCTGHCVGDARVLPGANEPCPGFACAPGAVCDRSTRTCVALQPAGAACTFLYQCDYGLLCVDHKCSALPALGERCTSVCRDAGATCGENTHSCIPAGLRGAACTIGSGLSACSPIYLCDRTSHCSAGLALGQPCGLGDRCADVDAFCDAPLAGGDGVCALPGPNGAPCTRDAGCTSFYCNPFTLRCAPEPVCL